MGGKQREIPVLHNLNPLAREFLEVARIEVDSKKSSPVPLAPGQADVVFPHAPVAESMGFMLKQRLTDADLPPIFSSPASAAWS